MVWVALSQQLSPQVLVDAHMLLPRPEPSSQPRTRAERVPTAQELPGQPAQSRLDPRAWLSGGCGPTQGPGAGNSKWRPGRKKGLAVATAPGVCQELSRRRPRSRDVQTTCPRTDSQSCYNDDLRWQKGLCPEDEVEALETEKGCWGTWAVPAPERQKRRRHEEAGA